MRCEVRSVAWCTAVVLLFTTPAVVHAQQASLRGRVRADSTRAPLVDAEIAVPALGRAARTDSVGDYSLSDLPSGRYEVVIRAIGHVVARESLTFSATVRLERDFVLTRVLTTLANVAVKARAPAIDMRLADFEDRRRIGMGKFITQDILEQTQGRRLADVLRTRLAGVRVQALGSGAAMVGTRGVGLRLPAGDMFDRRQGATQQCYVQVVVDGLLRYRGLPDEKLFDVNTILPEQLAGVELHNKGSVPSQFSSPGAECGTLILWTRMRY